MGLVNKNGSGNSAAKGSVAWGTGLKAEGENQTVIGSYNEANTTDLLQVAGGTANSARRNIITVDSSGVEDYKEIYILKDDCYVPLMYVSERDSADNIVSVDKVRRYG